MLIVIRKARNSRKQAKDDPKGGLSLEVESTPMPRDRI